MKIEENEKMILNELRKNARVSIFEVARKANMPISTAYDKLRGYEKERVIRKHSALIDFSSLGYHARKMVAIKVDKEARQEIQQYLENHPNVNNLYRINSGYDYLIEIVAKNAKDMNDVIEDLELQKGIAEKGYFDIIDEIKREAFVI